MAFVLMLEQVGDVFPGRGLDTHMGLIIVYLGGAMGFNAFLIKGFMDTFPCSSTNRPGSTGPVPSRSSGGSSSPWSALPSP